MPFGGRLRIKGVGQVGVPGRGRGREQELGDAGVGEMEEKVVVEKKRLVEKPLVLGKGKILVSGKSVYGLQTEFLYEGKQSNNNSNLYIYTRHPSTLQKIKAKPSLIASQASLTLSQGFGFDLSSYSEYWWQEIEQDEDGDGDELQEEYKKKLESLRRVKKIQKFEYRQKKGLGYCTRELECGEQQERPVQWALEQRTKRQRDRFC